MNPRDNVDVENALSIAMLLEVVVNRDVQLVLSKAVGKLKEKVLNPLKISLEQSEGDLSLIPKHLSTSLDFFARRHSKDDRQRGAIYPQLTSQQILGSPSILKKLLDEIDNILLNIFTLKSQDDVYNYIKIITELGYCYNKFPLILKNEDYETLYDTIYPSPIEESARISRIELGQVAMLATTTGIRMEDNDLVPLSEHKESLVPTAGKSVFGMVKFAKRMDLVLDEYRNAKLNLIKINESLLKVLNKDSAEFSELKKYQDSAEKQIKISEHKMLTLNIPFNDNDDKVSKRYESTIEKLSKMSSTLEHLPLVASLSGTMGRTLAAMMDAGSFQNENQQTDLNLAQIVSNCLMASLQYGGHHSFLELAESYNRLLDYVAIKKLGNYSEEKISQSDKESLHQRYFDCENIPEKILPYYIIGNYMSFFHISYRDNIFKNATLDNHNSDVCTTAIEKRANNL